MIGLNAPFLWKKGKTFFHKRNFIGQGCRNDVNIWHYKSQGQQRQRCVVDNIKKYMDSYLIGDACRESEAFFEVLNNWYIRRNKPRFWKSFKDQDKQDAYNTLYTVLVVMMEAIAPLAPFTAEYIWRGLNCGEDC